MPDARPIPGGCIPYREPPPMSHPPTNPRAIIDALWHGRNPFASPPENLPPSISRAGAASIPSSMEPSRSDAPA